MRLVKADGLWKGSEFVVMSPYRHYSPAHMGPGGRGGGGEVCMTGWCHHSFQLESVDIVYQTGGRCVTGLDRSGLTAAVGAKLCVLWWRMGSQLRSVPQSCCY